MATLMENMLHVYENLRGGVERVDGELLEPQDTEEGREEWLRTAQQDEVSVLTVCNEPCSTGSINCSL